MRHIFNYQGTFEECIGCMVRIYPDDHDFLKGLVLRVYDNGVLFSFGFMPFKIGRHDKYVSNCDIYVRDDIEEADYIDCSFNSNAALELPVSWHDLEYIFHTDDWGVPVYAGRMLAIDMDEAHRLANMDCPPDNPPPVFIADDGNKYSRCTIAGWHDSAKWPGRNVGPFQGREK